MLLNALYIFVRAIQSDETERLKIQIQQIPEWICQDVQSLMNFANSVEHNLENILNKLEQYVPGYFLELLRKLMQGALTLFDYVGVFIETALCGGR